MTAGTKSPEGWSLGRWSRLKREAAREKDTPAAPPADAAVPAVAATSPAVAAAVPSATAQADALPPVESLTIDSDFSAFLQPNVDDGLKRQALKQLFRDPRFNEMDGLDVYIDDYSIPDPIEPDVVRQMVQGRYIFDPPPTRINAQGFAEDVPADELARAAPDSMDATAADSATAPPQDSVAEVPPSGPTDGAEPPAR